MAHDRPNYVETLDVTEARLALKEARPEACDVEEARIALSFKPAAAPITSPLAALLALVDFAKRVSAGIGQLVAGLYDGAILNNPDAFALVSKATTVSIPDTTGKGIKVVTNDGNVPMLVRIQAPVSTTLNGVPSHLFLSDDLNRCTFNKATVIAFGVGAVASVVLPPSKSVFVNGTDPEGGTAFTVMATAVPLRGRAAIFTKG